MKNYIDFYINYSIATDEEPPRRHKAPKYLLVKLDQERETLDDDAVHVASRRTRSRRSFRSISPKNYKKHGYRFGMGDFFGLIKEVGPGLCDMFEILQVF